MHKSVTYREKTAEVEVGGRGERAECSGCKGSDQVYPLHPGVGGMPCARAVSIGDHCKIEGSHTYVRFNVIYLTC